MELRSISFSPDDDVRGEKRSRSLSGVAVATKSTDTNAKSVVGIWCCFQRLRKWRYGFFSVVLYYEVNGE